MGESTASSYDGQFPNLANEIARIVSNRVIERQGLLPTYLAGRDSYLIEGNGSETNRPLSTQAILSKVRKRYWAPASKLLKDLENYHNRVIYIL